MRKARDNTRFFGATCVVFAIMLIIISTISIINNNSSPEISSEPKAKVLTKFGCLTTTLTEDEFVKQQMFNRKILGYEYVQCK